MSKGKKKIILIVLGIFVMLIVGGGCYLYWLIYYNSKATAIPKNTVASLYWHTNVNPLDMKQVRNFCQRFGYNDDYYLVCDFGCRSGKKRFYLYDLSSGERIMSSYCMHGQGGGSTASKPAFSNKLGSNCSSLGLYALAGIGSKSFKNAIRLVGLSPSNYNAWARGILIHSAGKVSRFHGQNKYIPLGHESNGCFAIEFKALQRLMITYSLYGKQKRILLWAYM